MKSVFDESSRNEAGSNNAQSNKTIYTPKEVKTMSEQFITPHSRVWDRIEETLNEQDRRRENANQIIKSSFGLDAPNAPAYNSKKFYFATVAGLSLVAGIVWVMI